MEHQKRGEKRVKISESDAIAEAEYSNATEEKLGTNEEKPPKTEEEDSPPYSSFTKWQKAWMTFLVAFAGMFSPMSSFIYYPAINSLAEGLGTTVQNINLTITSYMVVSGVVPAIMGNLADTLGRRPIYILAFVIYLVANIGLAVQNSFPALLVLRMIQSAGSSGTISLGYGVIADIASPAERGSYVGLLLVGPNVAPPLGPVIGGAISDQLGWKYIFWVLCGLSGLCLLSIVLALPETARCLVGDGSVPPRGIYRPLLPILKHLKHKQTGEIERLSLRSRISVPNPIQSLRILLEKDSATILLCNGIFYATYCCLQASLSSLFISLYGYDELKAGLVYIPFGIGCLVATVSTGKLLDYDFARTAKAENIDMTGKKAHTVDGFPIEKARLRSIFYPTYLSAIAIIGYGWALEKKAHVAVALVIQTICGLTITSIFTSLGTLLTDIHPNNSSTAAAAANIVRCALAAGGTAVLQLMIDAMGPGWCFTLIGIICGLCVPLLLVERRYGPQWRSSRFENIARTPASV